MGFELERHTRLLIVFGFGDGQEVLRLIQALPRRSHLEILIVDPAAHRTNSAQDIQSLLEQDSCEFWVQKSLHEISQLAEAYFLHGARATYISAIQVYAHSREAPAHLDYFQKCQELFNRAIDFAARQFGNSVEDCWLGVENIFSNLDLMLSSPGIEVLKDIQKNRPVICVASGPSLSDSLDLLREQQKKFVIIAADSAAKPLYDNGIEPDFITAIERSSAVTRMFQMLPADCKARLVTLPLVLKESLGEYPGDIHFAFREGPWAEFLGVSREQSLTVGPSCAHLSYCLAAWMGASCIILIGQDLAYSQSGQSHVSGTGFEERDQENETAQLLARQDRRYFLTEANDGSQVVTEEYLDLFRLFFSRLIKETNIRTINTSLTGACIENAEVCSLEKVFDHFSEGSQHKDLQLKETKLPSISSVTLQKNIEFQQSYLENVQGLLHGYATKFQAIKEADIAQRAKELIREMDQWFADKVNRDAAFRAILLQILMPKIFQFEIQKNQLSQQTRDGEVYIRQIVELYAAHLVEFRKWTKKAEVLIAQYAAALISK